mgnify:CR=1 FL=1
MVIINNVFFSGDHCCLTLNYYSERCHHSCFLLFLPSSVACSPGYRSATSLPPPPLYSDFQLRQWHHVGELRIIRPVVSTDSWACIRSSFIHILECPFFVFVSVVLHLKLSNSSSHPNRCSGNRCLPLRLDSRESVQSSRFPLHSRLDGAIRHYGHIFH